MSSRLLIWSDNHIHPHKRNRNRMDDCLNCLNWVFDVGKKNDISTYIFCGDLFEDRQKIDVLAFQKTYEIIESKLRKKDCVYFLLGNHDIWHPKRRDISTIYALRNIPNLYIIDEPCILKLKNTETKAAFLPYSSDPIEDLNKLILDFPKLLFGHIAVNGAKLNSSGITSDVFVEKDNDMKIVGPKLFNGINRVFLGHYHCPQKLGDNVEYVGSPLQLSFGEINQDKHIIIYDPLTDERTYIKNDFSPKHYSIGINEIDNYNLEKCFVILNVDNISDSKLIDAKIKLIEEKKVASLEISLIPKNFDSLNDFEINNLNNILLNEEETFLNYLNEMEANNLLGELNKKNIIEMSKELFSNSNNLEYLNEN